VAGLLWLRYVTFGSQLLVNDREMTRMSQKRVICSNLNPRGRMKRSCRIFPRRFGRNGKSE
jgi:hypothetical protein